MHPFLLDRRIRSDGKNYGIVIIMKKILGLTILAVLSLFSPALKAAVVAPTLTIVTPKTGEKLSNDTVVVAATVKSTIAIAHVLYSVNGGSWSDANQSNTTWRVTANLVAGTNTIAMYAVDNDSDFSKTNAVKVNYIVTTPIAVTIVGEGKLTPDYTNNSLAISNSYTIKATADKGFKFYYWGGGVTMSTNPTLTFLMVPGLAITANFQDVTIPTVSITSPATGLKVSNAVLTVSGKAADNVSVTNVLVSVAGGDWTAATLSNNGSNWTVQVTLNAGTNTISAVAVDSSGNVSKTNSVKVVYVVNTVTVAGTWNIIQYKTPAYITNDINGNVLNGENFSVETGVLTFDTNGDVSGTIGDSFTGTYVLNGDGSIVLSITNSELDVETKTFYVNADEDTMNLVETELDDSDNNQELVIGVRIPPALTAAEVAGTFNVVQFQTPVQITGDANDGLQGGTQFTATNGTLTLAANGTFTGKVKNSVSGTFTIGDSGTVILHSSGGDTLTFYVNYNMDTAIEVQSQLDSNDNQQQLVVCHRQPASFTTASLAGLWNLAQFQTPAQMTDDSNNGLVGGNNFEETNGTMQILTSGSISGTLGNSFTGTVSASSKGVVKAVINGGDGSQPVTFYINASLDTMTEEESQPDANDNQQQIVIAHRAPGS